MNHKPVLLKEAVESLNISNGSIVVDCTFGHGGHSVEILKKLNHSGWLYGFDYDISAINYGKNNIPKEFQNFTIINKNFSEIKDYIEKNSSKKIDSVLFDLGVNSEQLTSSERGFSYKVDNYLDMRINRNDSNSLTAKHILNSYEESKLEVIFREYGDIPFSKILAKKIVDRRIVEPIERTFELNEIVDRIKKPNKNKNYLKTVYQALRIEVNNEINNLKNALQLSLDLVSVNGRVSVITFHSLEDKIVKDVFYKNKGIVYEDEKQIIHKYHTKKVVYPGKEEILENSKSRSAKLRTIVKKF